LVWPFQKALEARLRKPGFERLLKRPDKRHAEKRERDRFEHDSREIKRGDDEECCEEKLDAAARFNEARARRLAHLTRPGASASRVMGQVVLVVCRMKL